MYRFTSGSKPCLLITRSQKDISYLRDNFSELSSLCKSGVKTYSTFDKRTQKTYDMCKIQTRNLRSLEELYQLWYPFSEKTVPNSLTLSPLICAIWFCDDGSVGQSKNCKEDRIRLKLSTHGFAKKDTEFLADFLCHSFNEHFSIVQESGNHYIVGSDAATRAFVSYSQSELPVSMKRKYIWETLQTPKTRSQPQLRNRSETDLGAKELSIFKTLGTNPKEKLSPKELGKQLGWNRNGRAPTQIGYHLKRFLIRGWVKKTGVPHSYKTPIRYQLTSKGRKIYETVSDNSKDT